MPKEARLGILAIIIIAASIYGYKFVVGQNLFQKSLTFKTIYDDVTALTPSSPVYVNGLKVGAISAIDINPENVRQMIVTMRLERTFPLPKNTVAVQRSEGLVGGKGIALKFDKVCGGSDCLQNGDFINGESQGLIGAMLGEDDLGDMASTAGNMISDALNSLGKEGSEAALDVVIRELSVTMENMSKLTETTNKMMQRSAADFNKSFSNLESITNNLSQSNGQITKMLSNLEAITTDIKDANLGNTVKGANETITEAQQAMQKLDATLEESNKTFKQLNEVIAEVQNGEGSLAKLLNDKHLYDNLESTSKNMSLLLQDLRLNPKRYVSISVFGKGNKEYVKPEDDPAYKE